MKAMSDVHKIVDILNQMYPEADCSLEARDPFKLLVCAILASQCTDARVNIVAEELFSIFPDVQAFANCNIEKLQHVIRPCGFYRVKADSIKASSIALIERFDGRVPDTMEDLLSLSGVGRKIANLILGDIYNKPAIVTDTHCIRISNRIGLCDSTNPYKVELRLAEIIAEDHQSLFCHQLVFFGRDVCKAKNPACGKCPLFQYCDHGKLCVDKKNK